MNNSFESPESNDNRNYDYSRYPESERLEYSVILNMVKQNSSVIDLGCGNGTLLALLKKEKNIFDCGLEISPSGVAISQELGLNVRLGRIDEHLPFEDNAFDYAICNVTLQMVMYPEILMKEMKRISKYQIVSFPNFGFWKNRIEFLLKGKMPSKTLFGYSWYTTGHIHQLSINDFQEFIGNIGGLQVIDCQFADNLDFLKLKLANFYPNLFHLLPIFLLKKDN